MVNIPSMQKWIGREVSSAIGKEIGTEVSLGKINVGFLNRIIIDDVTIFDQASEPMIKASRVAAKIDYYGLIKNMQLYISSAQLFGFNGNFYKNDESSKANFQFLLDSLSSNNDNKESNFRLKIASLIIRNGALKYDRKDKEKENQKFSLDHLDVRDISANLAVPRYSKDSIEVSLRRLSLKEASGISLKDLSFSASLNKKQASLTDFHLSLPNTDIFIPKITAQYELSKKNELQKSSLRYEGELSNSHITLSDVQSLFPVLRDFSSSMDIGAKFSGGYDYVNIFGLNLNAQDNTIKLIADGEITGIGSSLNFNANVSHLSCDLGNLKSRLNNVGISGYDIPDIIARLGNISYNGLISKKESLSMLDGEVDTDIGAAKLMLNLQEKNISAKIETSGISLNKLLDDENFGQLATSIDIECEQEKGKLKNINLDGKLQRFDYNAYSYSNIIINGLYSDDVFSGELSLDDPNAWISLSGIISTRPADKKSTLLAKVKNLNLSALNLTDRWKGSTFDFEIEGEALLLGSGLQDFSGSLDVKDFSMNSQENNYHLDNFHVDAYPNSLSAIGDFGQIQVSGKYSLEDIKESFTNIIHFKLPSLVPGGRRANNNFSIEATINKTDWLSALVDVPLSLNSPLTILAQISDENDFVDLDVSSKSFSYDGSPYRNFSLNAKTVNDTLRVDALLRKLMDDGGALDFSTHLNALDDRLISRLCWDNHQATPMKGELNLETLFSRSLTGKTAIDFQVNPSEISVNDTLWRVKPSSINYQDGTLLVDHFSIEHNRQHVKISGKATKSSQDSILVDLNDVDVNYVLNLINFHTVEFKGYASGQACIKSVFYDPELTSNLKISQFRFQDGLLGELLASVNWDNNEKKIDIHAKAEDKNNAQTLVNGYVSLKDKYINLDIGAIHTNIDFLESFCSSFMDDVQAYSDGYLKVSGPLSNVNLTGQVVANGSLRIKPLNVTYSLKSDTINFIPDNILFSSDTIVDKNGNIGIVSGSLMHDHLTNLRYGVNIEARDLLCFDTKNFSDDTFYGTVYGTGTCSIRGGRGRVDMDIDLTPEKNSFIEYNATSPDAISESAFIKWNNVTPKEEADSIDEFIVYSEEEPTPLQETKNSFWSDVPSDIRINLVINTTPDATLRVLMDKQSNDYIALNGTGVITASYFNKGSFNMFGTYIVDHGEYKLTIQNIIRKVFNFQEGGSIVFTGNPYNASLNLQAVYTINSVPLSDLQLGSNFSSSNVRVDCLMNITGTPLTPHVDFGLNLPTISSDAEQMVRTIIDSEEEMNQQVVYLLGIGRFYIQGGNNSDNQTSQTSLAMQSLLSGTISQQINSILSSVVKNNNWTFGANISTGTEGFYNAEYEGLLSGHLLNNRLIINGQFGYRDNANATSSFIGDFDINYLLLPSGSIALKVYNQSNDRYFTKSSLNTQGIGVVMKKDFDLFKDLFKFSHKRSSKKDKSKEKEQ